MNESRPEPVGKQAAVVALLLVLLQAARAMNLWNLDDIQYRALVDVVYAGATVVFMYAGYRYARARVTPVTDPKAVNVHGKLVDLVTEDGSQLPKEVK